ncbi:hypothetical protein SAMN05216484_1181, partial [Proteus mirabilis]
QSERSRDPRPLGRGGCQYLEIDSLEK